MTTDNGEVLHREDPTKWSLDKTNWNRAGYTRYPQDPPDQGYIACCYGTGASGDRWRPAPVHQGGTNVAFVDGHAKWYLTSKLVNPPRASAECLYDNGP